ncbi:hypothetical protein AAFF_G00415700 [Aldrovandia affinis]|uniref:Uncharacterized protein n=1 Tax=Aldrovandia affinis TaxID=143900 RepID=A0AAD7WJD0_9TELE|nr:hypothetical protein AAFF_G00415700 [Aldrovandia affinis]
MGGRPRLEHSTANGQNVQICVLSLRKGSVRPGAQNGRPEDTGPSYSTRSTATCWTLPRHALPASPPLSDARPFSSRPPNIGAVTSLLCTWLKESGPPKPMT